MTKDNDIEHCPECKVSFDGGPIPDDIKEHYAPPYRWSRKIGIEDPMVYDGVSWWQCPDCKHTWKRFEWSPEYNQETVDKHINPKGGEE